MGIFPIVMGALCLVQASIFAYGIWRFRKDSDMVERRRSRSARSTTPAGRLAPAE